MLRPDHYRRRGLALAVLIPLLIAPTARAQEEMAAEAAAPVVEEPAAPPEVTAAELEALDPLNDALLQIGIEESLARKNKLRAPDVLPEEVGSLLFTLWQHTLLQEAKRNFLARPPGMPPTVDAPALTGNIGVDRPAGEVVKGIREVSLGGIVYVSPQDWTIWLNGQRIKPNALPKEVINIKVGRDYVEMKWYDAYTERIYPIRMRPHQRFNLDARLFLPGTPPEASGVQTP